MRLPTLWISMPPMPLGDAFRDHTPYGVHFLHSCRLSCLISRSSGLSNAALSHGSVVPSRFTATRPILDRWSCGRLRALSSSEASSLRAFVRTALRGATVHRNLGTKDTQFFGCDHTFPRPSGQCLLDLHDQLAGCPQDHLVGL